MLRMAGLRVWYWGFLKGLSFCIEGFRSVYQGVHATAVLLHATTKKIHEVVTLLIVPGIFLAAPMTP